MLGGLVGDVAAVSDPAGFRPFLAVFAGDRGVEVGRRGGRRSADQEERKQRRNERGNGKDAAPRGPSVCPGAAGTIASRYEVRRRDRRSPHVSLLLPPPFSVPVCFDGPLAGSRRFSTSALRRTIYLSRLSEHRCQSKRPERFQRPAVLEQRRTSLSRDTRVYRS